MWEDLLNFSGDAWEGLSEGAGTVFDGYIALEKAKIQEAAKDPEVLKANEPVKGTNTDGSTQTAIPMYRKPFVTGVDDTVVLILGFLLVAGLGFLVARGR
ncbi:MAG: hypothetical protein ACI9LM_000110 [Alteromonadaceae bacterium]|jgi:hypothetical protein